MNQLCCIKPVDHVLKCYLERFAVSQPLSYLATCQADTFQQQQRWNAHRLVQTRASVRTQSHAVNAVMVHVGPVLTRGPTERSETSTAL